MVLPVLLTFTPTTAFPSAETWSVSVRKTPLRMQVGKIYIKKLKFTHKKYDIDFFFLIYWSFFSIIF